MGHSSPTRNVLGNHLEFMGDFLWIEGRRAALDVFIGCIATILEMNTRRNFSSSFHNSGGNFHLTGRDGPEESVQNYFSVRGGGSPDFSKSPLLAIRHLFGQI